ncbi:THAP domain-containing protein 2-like isoform X1 [Acyrthosiphon pisum]|uniref:THAP-type domain-containing protein n=1 Tax=Acyrthosiphon pisum TaxID=7029 RepID=A0A8R2D6C3_ACYPI|nr:THAP domain-containing protein 2-like isoform X1 [Acyrthosiphon pisum]XP_016662189.1 THAP domain-containing protein 2-like isoform X1 [Acyrthosiphon pisum]|eukprot:XP_016661738.1 PREDICTED: THAP domain-containing protein 2-like isoform X1 [Acyrthosiphon pisum]
MVNCWAPQCSHNSVRESCSFFRFPTDVALRNSWANLVRRADSIPSNNSRLCSCHFKDGLKENSPSIFAWNENKINRFVSPEKRKRTSHSLLLIF